MERDKVLTAHVNVVTQLRFVNAHFGKNTVIVFDGYPEYPTTKGQAHMLRYRKQVPEVQSLMASLIFYLIQKIKRPSSLCSLAT
jgi:hypothetical protein